MHFKLQGRDDSVIDIRKALLPEATPKDHRDPSNPIKSWMAYLNLLRTLVGPGVLVIPLAISQAGMAVGPVMTIFTGLLVMHTHLMLLNALTEIRRQLKIPYISYRNGFRIALLHGPSIFHSIGNHGPAVIATFMFLSQLGICTVFVLLSADSIRDLMDWQSNETALLILLVPFMVLEYCMKNLQIVTYVSSVGALLNFIALSLIFYLMLSHQHGERDVQTKTDAMFVLYAFGAILFNQSAVGVILALDKNLKEAKIMTIPFGVVTVGILIPTIVLVAFGTLAYWSFGIVEENVLRSLPLDDTISIIIMALYLVSVAFLYPIQCHPAIAVIIEVFKYNDPLNAPDESTIRAVKLFSRPMFVLLTFFISYLMPFQGPFVAFVGNLCTNVLSLIFPALMDTCLRYPDNYGTYNILLIKNVLIICLGIVAWIFVQSKDGILYRAASERLLKINVQPSVFDVAEMKLPSVKPESTDYDPRDHRTPLQPIKPWMAYFNLLRTMCGAGLLGMPGAVSQAGIILGPILALFTGVLLIHTQTMLLESLTEISRQLRIPHVSYRYGFRLAVLHGPSICHGIGRRGPAIIGTFMFLNQLGLCTVFVSLTSDSLRDLMDWQSNRPALLTLLFPYLLLEFFMKTLKIVSYASLMGSCLNLLGIVLITVQCFSNLTGDLVSIRTSPMGIMLSFGVYLFNMSAVAVILAIDKALKEAKLMTSSFGVINVGIFVPCVIATIFGVVGYCSFGTMEDNILRSLPLDEISSIAAISLSLFAVAFAYPIQCYPGVSIILEVIKYHKPWDPPSPESLQLIESIARPIFVVISFILSYLLPFQATLVPFVGNMCTSMLALVFPALMDVCLRYPNDYGSFNLIMFKDVIIIALGIASQIFGVFECSYLMYVRVLAFYSPNFSGFY